MKRYILFTDDELVKLAQGHEIEHHTSGGVFYFMSKKYFDNLNKTAKWLGEPGEYICSHCGEEAPNDGYWPSPFCPNCGVKME